MKFKLQYVTLSAGRPTKPKPRYLLTWEWDLTINYVSSESPFAPYQYQGISLCSLVIHSPPGARSSAVSDCLWSVTHRHPQIHPCCRSGLRPFFYFFFYFVLLVRSAIILKMQCVLATLTFWQIALLSGVWKANQNNLSNMRWVWYTAWQKSVRI